MKVWERGRLVFERNDFWFVLEAKLDEQSDEEEDEDLSSSSSSISIDNRPEIEQRQHRCIKQMGKLTKVC